MTVGVLDVLIAGKLAGTLSQDGAGSLSFAYERGYRGVPLSSSMPLSTRPYRGKVALPYLWGAFAGGPGCEKARRRRSRHLPQQPLRAPRRHRPGLPRRGAVRPPGFRRLPR